MKIPQPQMIKQIVLLLIIIIIICLFQEIKDLITV